MHLDAGGFVENLGRLQDAGLAGFLILGSNGEANLLSDDEKLELMRVARAMITEKHIMMVGTGCESTQATIEFTQKAADCGADYALVLTPSFYKPSESGLLRHFEAVADASPIPTLLYNVPKYTGLNLPVSVALELSGHENIVGMKDSAGQMAQLVELKQKLPSDFALFLGADPVFFAGLAHGVSGAVLALANVAPQECVELYESVKNENWLRAQELADLLAPVGRIVVGKYGVPGLKTALNLLGAQGGVPRLPLLPLEELQVEEVRQILSGAGLLKENLEFEHHETTQNGFEFPLSSKMF